MNTEYIEEVYREKETKLKKSSNRFLYTFIVIFVLGYVFFFTSKLWLPNTYEGVDTTPIGTTIEANNRNITVDSWTYSEEQKLMEIIVEIENLSIDGIDDYEWGVMHKDGRYVTKVVAADENFFILRIEDVSSDWTELSLNIDIPSEAKSSNNSFEPIKIYTNNKIVKSVSSITKKTMDTYKKTAYISKIESYNAEITKNKKELEKIDTSIQIANKKIAELKEKISYQTKNEQKSTNDTIEQLLNEKLTLEDTAKAKENTIVELKEKILYQTKILKNL